MTFDSPEERYFYDWLTDLKAESFVEEVIAEPEYKLLDPVKIRTKKQLKTKVKEEESLLMHGLSYKPDFEIVWNEEKARGIFCFCEGDVLEKSFSKSIESMMVARKTADGKLVSTIDIKGTFAARHNSSTIKFPLLQKFLYNLKGIFVQKVMPLHKTRGLFASTFTPQSYWYTEKKKQLRKTKWIKLTLADYLTKIENNVGK